MYITNEIPTYNHVAPGVVTFTYSTADGKGLTVENFTDITVAGLYLVKGYTPAGIVADGKIEAVTGSVVKGPGTAGLLTAADEETDKEKIWHYTSDSKLVVFVDGVLTNGYTFETLPVSSEGLGTVRAYIAPVTVTQGETVVLTDWIDTAYVNIDYTQAVDYAQVNTIGVYDVKTTSGAPTGLYAIESQLVFADGTTKNVTVDAIVGTDGVAHTAKDIATNSLYGYNSATRASLPDLELDAFTYAVNATTGNYTLTMIPAEASEENATIYASQFFAKIGGQFPYVANNATTFVVRTGTPATGYTWTVYTGFEKLPSLKADKATVTVVDKNHDGVQDLVFIESNYDFVAANEYVYITSSYPTVNYVNGLVVSYTYPTTDGTITVSAQSLINYEWVTYDPNFGYVKHSATVTALNFVGGDITCTKDHTTYTGCTDGHRATAFNGVGLYKVTQKDAAGAVTLLEKVDVRTVVAPGYEGLIKVEKIANEDAVAPIQENWHYNSNSKLVVFVDGVPTDGFTFETLYANSYEKDEYSVQAEIIPQTVVQGSTVVATDWIGTMYVTITLNH